MSVETWLRHVGAAIRKRRKEKKWEQDDLERKSGISRKTISQIENGKSAHTDSVFTILCALNIDPWTLLGGVSPRLWEIDGVGQSAHDKLQELLKLPNDTPKIVIGVIDSFHIDHIRRKR